MEQSKVLNLLIPIPTETTKSTFLVIISYYLYLTKNLISFVNYLII